MNKISLVAGIAMALSSLVALVLVALGSYPAVADEALDGANQMVLLLMLVLSGVNFWANSFKFHPAMGNFPYSSNLLLAASGAASVFSYFTEAQLLFSERSMAQSSLVLLFIGLGLYFIVARFNKQLWSENGPR